MSGGELAPFPAAGRVYRHRQRVGPADVDPAGGAHLDAIARWLQDAAFLDVHDAGLIDSPGWIVRRTRIRIERRPAFAERLELGTACSGLAASVAERRTSIRGEAGAAVEAEAIWVQVDPETRMPARFGPRFLAVYGPTAGERRARSRLRHPAPADPAERIGWSFAAADLDLADHVNNAVYWRIAEQHLGGGLEPADLEIEYRGGLGAGPATILRDGRMLWVTGGSSGEVAASIRRR